MDINAIVEESLQSIFIPTLLKIIAPVLIFFLLIELIKVLSLKRKFDKSSYKETNKNGFFKTISNTGNTGEFLTFLELEKTQGFKKIIANTYLYKKDGKTTEIDLILISQKGIYVIENKNYKGAIFGKEADLNWTQVIGRKKYKFYNPIKQNEGHLKALYSQLPHVPKNKIFSYVVFGNKCDLRKVFIDKTTPVVRTNTVKTAINKNNKNLAAIFTLPQVEEIYHQLKTHTNVSQEIKNQHIYNIEQTVRR